MYPCTVVVLILPLKRTAWLLSKRLAINILLTSVRLKLFKKEICSFQEFQGLFIPHVQAWELLGNEHLCPSLYSYWVQMFPSILRGVQAWT